MFDVAMLVALNRLKELRLHGRSEINSGATPGGIVATIVQTSVATGPSSR